MRLLSRTTLVKLETGPQGFVATTDKGRIEARRVVNCAGAEAGRLAAQIGLDFAIDGFPIQVSVTEPVAPLIDHLVYAAGDRLTLKQSHHGGFLIGGGWPARLDETTGRLQVDPKSLAGNLRVALRLVPDLAGVAAPDLACHRQRHRRLAADPRRNLLGPRLLHVRGALARLHRRAGGGAARGRPDPRAQTAGRSRIAPALARAVVKVDACTYAENAMKRPASKGTGKGAKTRRRPRGTGASSVYESLKTKILNLELKPGTLLDETELSRHYHLSRSPVREALIRLSAEGLVERPRNRSSMVSQLDFSALPAYFDAMQLLTACPRGSLPEPQPGRRCHPEGDRARSSAPMSASMC